MKKQVIAMITAIAVAGIPLAVLAEQGTKDEVYELKKVEVKADKDKKEMKDDSDQAYNVYSLPESSKATTQTFTKKDIEAMHPKDVTEIIEHGLGMYQYRYGGRSFFMAKSRGGDNLGIVLDGVYLPQTVSMRVMYTIPVEMIESVTIVRDASALTLGPLSTIGIKDNCVGSGNQGFIMIETRKSTTKENEIKASYGSLATKKISIFTGDKIANHGFYDFSYSNSKTNGDLSLNNWSNFDSFAIRSGEQYDDYMYNFSAFYNHGSRGAFYGLSEDGSITTTNRCNYPYMSSLLAAVNAVKTWDKNHITGLNFGYGEVESDITTNGGSPTSEDEYFKQLNLFHTIKSGSNTLRIGGQAIQWKTPTGIGGGGIGKSREEELFGYYVYDEKQLSDRLTLDGGVRIDHKQVIKAPKNQYGLVSPFWEAPATSVAVGATYRMNPIYSLTSRIAYTDQPTDSSLSFVDGKTSLPSEKRKKYEAGIDANFSPALHAALTAFYYDISNAKYIGSSVYINAVSGYQSYYDAADMIRKGLELSFDGQLSKTWSYRLGYSNYDSSNSTDSASSPHNTYTIGFNYKKDDFDANINLRHVSQFYSIIATKTGTTTSNLKYPVGNYTTADLNFGKMMDKNTKVTLFVRNLADRKYPLGYASGYFYDYGRTYGVEVTKKF